MDGGEGAFCKFDQSLRDSRENSNSVTSRGYKSRGAYQVMDPRCMLKRRMKLELPAKIVNESNIPIPCSCKAFNALSLSAYKVIQIQLYGFCHQL